MQSCESVDIHPHRAHTNIRHRTQGIDIYNVDDDIKISANRKETERPNESGRHSNNRHISCHSAAETAYSIHRIGTYGIRCIGEDGAERAHT